ncbi:unnamed protein product [Rotaria sp. Silwood2]|nr:unnamed protein product [Rotaria sp. Silwood2]CAF2796847.1 unnamed protein product [Rotaria sp. Silwood2]CAF3065374.1 unnamed protein product [Rotaria sp. Silwood2]CAF3212817.1 unnamed protein product [Rotaria sp. Silwood2]
MDDNILENDEDSMDYDREFSNSTPFPPKCENEIVGIDSLTKCFEQRYDACPVFFRGSLRDACQAAFNPIVIQERRPVLVYIHNDESLLSNIFCKTIFCSTTIIDYLLENYIVWPWDITFQSNKNS